MSPSPPPTLAEALDALIAETTARVSGRLRSAATLKMQRQHVAYLLERLGPQLLVTEIDEAVIERFVGGEGAGRRRRADGTIRSLAPTTILKRLSTLRRALKIQKRRRAIDRIPEFPEILSDYQPDVKYIPTFLEAERIAAALPPHRADWFWLALFTGQHPSDVERMTREDLDPRRGGWVRVRNTKNRRFAGVRIGCPAHLARVFRARWRELGAGERLVVPWPHVSSQLPYLCEQLGLPRYTAKNLRHTFFTWMISRVGITKAVMEIGGWTTYEMVVKVYGHALPAQFDEAVRAFDKFMAEGRRKKISVGVDSTVGAAKNELPVAGVDSTSDGRNAQPGGDTPVRTGTVARDRVHSVGAVGLEPTTSGLRVRLPLSSDAVSPPVFTDGDREWNSTTP